MATSPLSILKKVFPDYEKCKGMIPRIYSNQWLEKIGVPKKKLGVVSKVLEEQSFFVKGKSW